MHCSVEGVNIIIITHFQSIATTETYILRVALKKEKETNSIQKCINARSRKTH
jgi:hypothetical protein